MCKNSGHLKHPKNKKTTSGNLNHIAYSVLCPVKKSCTLLIWFLFPKMILDLCFLFLFSLGHTSWTHI